MKYFILVFAALAPIAHAQAPPPERLTSKQEAESFWDLLRVVPSTWDISSTVLPYPVIFVHGLNSEEQTWYTTIKALQNEGLGHAWAFHFDLNADSVSTAWYQDVKQSVPTDYWEFGEDTFVGSIPERGRDLPSTDAKIFAVNFMAAFGRQTGLVHIHRDREEILQSNSNESAIVKQGAALQRAIHDVLVMTGAEKVILVGHSMGGLAIREYLQRHNTGRPKWWARSGSDGHRVAGVVTYGTPHQGSNHLSNPLASLVAWWKGIDESSEAVRDLRYSHSDGNAGLFLYGGDETSGSIGYYNWDVDASGALDEDVRGVNGGHYKQGAYLPHGYNPFPSGIPVIYLVGRSENFPSLGDTAVDVDRQFLWTNRNGEPAVYPETHAWPIFRDGVWHPDQTSDAHALSYAITWTAYNAIVLSGEEPETVEPDDLTIYPNPANSRVTLRLGGLGAARTVQIYDLLGRQVARLDLTPGTSHDLALDHLATGVYAATVEGTATRTLFTVVR